MKCRGCSKINAGNRCDKCGHFFCEACYGPHIKKVGFASGKRIGGLWRGSLAIILLTFLLLGEVSAEQAPRLLTDFEALEAKINNPEFSPGRCLADVGPFLSLQEMVAWSEELFSLHRKSLNALQMAKAAKAPGREKEAALFERRARQLFNRRVYRQRALIALARERAEKERRRERKKVWDEFHPNYPVAA